MVGYQTLFKGVSLERWFRLPEFMILVNGKAHMKHDAKASEARVDKPPRPSCISLSQLCHRHMGMITFLLLGRGLIPACL